MIEQGKSYKDHKGTKWECIFNEGDLAWMRAGKDQTAYVFYRDGTAKCLFLDPTCDVDWGGCP